ncbi:hypothetical protein Acsp07_09640 [Actinomycetospora sp. NBRC 106378]|nr:hypothetical protein Acsp07_09640 [Actinomycetospora sp. NBRC 106378]
MIQNISAVVTAVGVVLAALSIRAAQRQRLRSFEAFYVQRYWSLMDSMSLAALRLEADYKLRTRDEKAVRSYIRLCEDECELREKGWITDATWKIWADGMKVQLEREPFAQVWKDVCAQQGAYQYQLLQRLQKKDWQPTAIRPSLPRRVRAGLTGSSGV